MGLSSRAICHAALSAARAVTALEHGLLWCCSCCRQQDFGGRYCHEAQVFVKHVEGYPDKKPAAQATHTQGSLDDAWQQPRPMSWCIISCPNLVCSQPASDTLKCLCRVLGLQQQTAPSSTWHPPPVAVGPSLPADPPRCPACCSPWPQLRPASGAAPPWLHLLPSSRPPPAGMASVGHWGTCSSARLHLGQQGLVHAWVTMWRLLKQGPWSRGRRGAHFGQQLQHFVWLLLDR